MSLQLYFYRVPKGKSVNVNKKEWYTQRRMYFTFDMLKQNNATVNNGDLYKLGENTLKNIKNLHNELSRRFTVADILNDYDLSLEFRGLAFLEKHNWDFEKFDYYMLNA